MTIFKTSNLISFNRLNENNVVNLYTMKPYNFRKGFVDDKSIDSYYCEIENKMSKKFNKIIKPGQNHTSVVKIVNQDNINEEFNNVDGLITNLKNVALVTSLADCQGILLYDNKNKVIGNIHSGWKGTLNRIIENAINLMISVYNSSPSDIEAYICPSILKCCFEVDEDVKNLFMEKFDDIEINKLINLGKIKDNKQKYLIDTISINKLIMLNLGLKEENIVLSNICTKCNNNLFHSHRGDGINSGRNIALISLE